MKRQRLAEIPDLPPGATRKFDYRDADGIAREGFVANVGGEFVAFENTCRHLPVSLDYADNRFFTQDGKFFICQTHGATYEPLTGLCVRGPCQGASLKRLSVEVDAGAVWFVQ
jgi:nitrite reductase/ring-hydroxylating ferredoxin subunit